MAQDNNKKVLFLSRKDDRNQYDTAASMAAAMRKQSQDIKYDDANLEDLVFSYDGTDLTITVGSTKHDLQDYDGIFLLAWFQEKITEDLAMAVAYYADHYNIPVMNSEALHIRSRTKLSQYVLAALNNVACLPFVFSMNAPQLLSHSATKPLPFIAKAVMAARGKDNHLVKSHAELATILSNSPVKAFVLQDFVPNDGDYRLLVMGDEVTLAMHRKASGDSHLNNTSQGGQATLTPLAELDSAMLADAVKLSKLFHREVTGVDMVVHRDNGTYSFLEINNMPQLSTGSAVEDKIRVLHTYIEKRVAID